MRNTVLILTNKDATGLMGMEEAIRLMEEAYHDFGLKAQVIPRRRIHLPPKGRKESTWFWLNAP